MHTFSWTKTTTCLHNNKTELTVYLRLQMIERCYLYYSNSYSAILEAATLSKERHSKSRTPCVTTPRTFCSGCVGDNWAETKCSLLLAWPDRCFVEQKRGCQTLRKDEKF